MFCRVFLIAVIAAVSLLVPACGRKEAPSAVAPAPAPAQSVTILAMGSVPIEFVFYGRDQAANEADVEACRAEEDRLENILNRYRPDATVSRLNRMEPGIPMTVEPELIEMLNLSRKVFDLTGGAFDPTVGPLILLWKEAGKTGKLPADAKIAAVKAEVGFDAVEIGTDTVTLKRKVYIDLGGIAKGYIVDKLVSLLQARGVERGIVNAGGDLRVYGTRAGGFKIGITDPENKAALKAVKVVEKGAVVTSGSYEQFSMIEGRRYSHIIDPRTGRPVENDSDSVSIYAAEAGIADGLATGVFVMGFEAGRDLIKQLPDIGCYLIRTGGEQWEEEF